MQIGEPLIPLSHEGIENNMLATKLKNFKNDTQGNIAVVSAIGLSAILLCVGAASDYNYAVNLKSKLSSSVDIAVLSAVVSGGNSSKELSKKELRRIARQSFNENYQYAPGQTLKSFKLTKSPQDIVRVEATVTHEPFFAKILGKKTIDISVAAESLLPSLNAFDIALVLDRTGSMAGTNLTNLKTAATDFLNDMDDGNNDVKVSVVPFAQYVNIGLNYANQSWLDLPRNSAGGDDVTCNMEYTSNSSCFNPYGPPPPSSCQDGQTTTFEDDGTTQTTTTTTITNNGNGTCTTRVEKESVSGNSRSSSTSSRTASISGPSASSTWSNVSYASNGNYCVYAPDPADVSNNQVEECAVNNTIGNWYGCVGSRLSPNNIEAAYNRNKIPPVMEITCGQAMQPLTDDIGAAKDTIRGLTASGGTYLPSGLMWGWRNLDPARPLKITGQGKKDRQKLMIFMTDGQNTLSQSGLHHTARDYAAANDVTESLCEKIKESDIKIATVSYSRGTRNSATTDLLKKCASSDSLYFEAKDANSLKDAFTNAVNNSRVVRLVN